MKISRFGVVRLVVTSAFFTQIANAQNQPDDPDRTVVPAQVALPGSAPVQVASPISAVQPTLDSDSRVNALEQQNDQLAARLAKLEAKDATKAVLAAEKSATQKKSEGVQVTPYGFVKLGIAYDTERTAYGDLSFYVLPDSRAGGGKPELTFGARESRFGVKLSAPEVGGIVATGQFEADWFEDLTTTARYSPRLRLAFVELALGAGWSVRAGQDWDLYVTMHPKVVDAGTLGGTGHLYGRRPQLRLTKAFKFNDTDGVVIKLAAEHGRGQDIDADGQIDVDAAAVPSIHGSIVLSVKLLSSKPTLVSVSGAYGKEKVNLPFPTATTPSDHSKQFVSSMVHGSLQLPLAKFLSIQGVVWWGKNVDQYLGGILQGIDATAEKEIEAVGGWGQVLVDLTSAWAVSAGFGADNPVNDDVVVGRTFNSRTFGNVFFKATNDVTIAAEYGYLRTHYSTERLATDNRTQLAFQYSF